jgi:hypothetical protein
MVPSTPHFVVHRRLRRLFLSAVIATCCYFVFFVLVSTSNHLPSVVMTTKLQPPEYSLDQAGENHFEKLYVEASALVHSRSFYAFLFACTTPSCTFEDNFLLYRLLFQKQNRMLRP